MELTPLNIYIITTFFITYSDDYNSNNQCSFSSRQLNNRGFTFGVLNHYSTYYLFLSINSFNLALALSNATVAKETLRAVSLTK